MGMLKSLSLQQATWLVFAITLAVILGAWGFQFAGYEPCELCLKQRWAYYAVVPISAALALIAGNNPKLLRQGLILLGLIMLASCIFGIYHSGVEWKFWAGPTTCTGGGDAAFTSVLPDLSKPAVMCDQPAIRILGISLAGYNALISAFVFVFAFAKAKQA
jgi:disulfide bond formation protein DsbB